VNRQNQYVELRNVCLSSSAGAEFTSHPLSGPQSSTRRELSFGDHSIVGRR
jgi:hypothetical protein